MVVAVVMVGRIERTSSLFDQIPTPHTIQRTPVPLTTIATTTIDNTTNATTTARLTTTTATTTIATAASGVGVKSVFFSLLDIHQSTSLIQHHHLRAYHQHTSLGHPLHRI